MEICKVGPGFLKIGFLIDCLFYVENQGYNTFNCIAQKNKKFKTADQEKII